MRLGPSLFLAAALIASPVFAKTMRVGVGIWPPAMGNPYGQQIQGAVHPFPGMFDSLTFMDTTGETLPSLATSWTNDNPTTWTFKLRPGVSFMNGEPFTAAAVVAMVDMLKQPASARFFYAVEVKNIASVNALDDLTVVFITQTPDVILPKRLSLLTLVPPKLWKEVGPDNFAQKPRATGPFVVDSWGRDKGYYALEAKSGPSQVKSWRPSKYLDRVEFRIIPDQAARIQALKTGQIDMAYDVGFEDFEDLEANGFKPIVKVIATSTAIALSNMKKGSPLVDQRVRQAMNYAVDRETIAKFILRDTVKPSSHGISPGVFGYNPAITGYPYDPAKAKALLAEAGFAKGFKLKSNLLIAGRPEVGAVFQKVAQDLAAVGIDLQINAVQGTEWVQMWSSGDWRGADVISTSWNGATYMDAGRAVESFTAAKSGPFFSAPKVEALLAASTIEFDVKKREAQLQEALAMLHDLAPALYLFPQTEIMAVSSKVKNIAYRGRYIDWAATDISP